jgi:uncharacterized protein YcnI
MKLRFNGGLALGAAAVAAAAALIVPTFSSGHATVSPLQPQGTPLTSARTTYAVRAPNEKEAQNTWKIVMYVSPTVQEAIQVQQSPDWKIRLDRVATGKLDSEGGKVFATRRISWTAKTKDAEIEPGMFGQWLVRFQNPSFATKLCFGMSQFYRNTDGSRRNPEIVHWTGPATADTPSSCVEVKPA